MRRRGFDLGIWLVVCALAIFLVFGPVPLKNHFLHRQNEKVTEAVTEDMNPSSPLDEPVTEKETTTDDSKKEKPVSTTLSDKPYLIKVNRRQNVVTVYSRDENGAYTVPVRAFVCSAGRGANTPLGTYRTSTKYTWKILVGDVWGQYSTRIVGGVLFHSVPYVEKTKNSLEYWEYNRLGTNRSLGCIRLTVIDAKWIFDNCPLGTTVVIYESSDPGPLGKPSAPRIDTTLSIRGWDPTDPDPGNPWRNYTPPTEPVATRPSVTTTKPVTDTTEPTTSDITESTAETTDSTTETTTDTTEESTTETTKPTTATKPTTTTTKPATSGDGTPQSKG